MTPEEENVFLWALQKYEDKPLQRYALVHKNVFPSWERGELKNYYDRVLKSRFEEIQRQGIRLEPPQAVQAL